MVHIVERGETLFGIARKYNKTVSEIKKYNNLSTNIISIGQKIGIPGTESPEPKPKPQPEIKVHIYTVVAGDSLYRISRKFGVSVKEIRATNDLKTNFLSIGQRLLIPGEIPEGIENTSSEEKKSPAKKEEKAPKPSPKPSPKPEQSSKKEEAEKAPEEDKPTPKKEEEATKAEEKDSTDSQNIQTRYTVKKGDSLYRIGKNYGVSPDAIMAVNKMQSNALSLGQVLLIPVAGYKPDFFPKLDTEVGEPDEQKLIGIRKHLLSVFKLKYSNGIKIFGAGLDGAVGKTNYNRPNDLQKVQERLSQLNLLTAYSSESADRFRRSRYVRAEQIPRTISALERFQRLRRIEWWAQNASKLLGVSGYTNGLVMPNDTTYKLLREFTEYNLQYKDYNNVIRNASFTNFPRSRFSVYPHGVSFAGSAMHYIPSSYYENLGTSPEMARVLEFVSSNEGNYDAINSYDRAVFSYGFIQFAGSAASGTLPNFLALIKDKSRSLFYDAFERFGIDVEYSANDQRYEKSRIVVLAPDAYDGRHLLRGTEAEKYIRANKLLHGVFIRAGQDPEIARMQVMTAVLEYVTPALSRRVSFNVNGIEVNNQRLTEFIRSEAGLTVLIDMAVNQGLGGASKLFINAISGVAKQDNIRTYDALKGIDERKVIRYMSANSTDSRVQTRPLKVLEKGLSTLKRNV